MDATGHAYVTGETSSLDFPTTLGAFQPTGSWSDAFVTKFALGEIGFSVLGVIPSKGGNTGSVSVIIHGGGFVEGVTVKLARAGQPDIVGDPVSVSEDGGSITTTFDLTGKALGLWDVVVTNPDGESATLPEGFTIEEGGAPHVWMDILGRDQIRAGRPATFNIVFGSPVPYETYGDQVG